MVGAAFLAGRAALRLGAGRVYLGMLEKETLAVDPVQPELMLRAPADALGMATVHHKRAEETIPQLEELLEVSLR